MGSAAKRMRGSGRGQGILNGLGISIVLGSFCAWHMSLLIKFIFYFLFLLFELAFLKKIRI